MATLTPELLVVIRQQLDDPEPTPMFEDIDIEAHWNAAGQSTHGALALLWSAKAAKLVEKVSIASGPTRIELSQKFEHAKKMAEHFVALAGGVEVLGDGAFIDSVQMSNTDAFDPEYTEYTWP